MTFLRCLFLPVCLLAISACTPPDSRWVLQGKTMGTSWHVVAIRRGDGANTTITQVKLQRLISAELDRLNALMSTWQPDSELSQFNRSGQTAPQSLSAETLELIGVAGDISARTGGAFDVTRGNVFGLWGFGGSDGAELTEPTAAELTAAMQASGYQQLRVTEGQISRLNPALTVDLSSIAKGYAVDRLGVLLEEAGLGDYLVEIGGEIRTRGRSLSGERWRIGVESPAYASPHRADQGIAVTDAHIASSGDYRNFREVGGRRVTHIIDGRTGYPITHDLAAVTVLHESTALADAWATAFMVLGYDASATIAREDSLAASFTVRGINGFEVRSTPQWLILQQTRPQVR